jgi:ABC-type branched-subunit amino acid transport system substrate-binding protein
MATFSLASCGRPAEVGAPTAKVAYLQNLDVPDHVEIVSQAFLSLDDRFQGTGFQVVDLDAGTAGSAAAAAAEVAGDPSFVAAVIAPFLTMPGSAILALRRAGTPVIALSSAPSSPHQTARAAPGAWIRWVADRAAQADLVARLARQAADGGKICVAAAEDAWSAGMGHAVLRAAGASAVDLGGLDGAEGARRPRCDALAWSGFSDDAIDLRDALPPALPMVVTDGAQTASYLAAAPADAVTWAACTCVDLSTSTALDAQRFLNAFQAANGLGPGVYAAEAWDLAGLIAGTPGAVRRSDLNTAMGSLVRYEGVAGVYQLGPSGDGVGVHAARAVGSRWVPVPAPARAP